MNDSLTGLYNRSEFFNNLRGMVRNAAEFGVPVGLLVIDIQRFRIINKNFGYEEGNIVLQAVADALKKICREGDCLARIGDDQFAMLLARVANKGHAHLAAMKIQRLLDVPIKVNRWTIRCSTIIGISLCPYNASEPQALLQAAELALAQAKNQGQRIGFSEKKREEGISEDWDIEISLGESIMRSELRVFFQPKVSLKTGKPVGAEALVRWQSATRGLISPAVFLPVAEEIGFLNPLTMWMLNSTLRMSSEWTQKWGKLSVSVNVPPAVLEQPDFEDLVLSAEKLWQRENVDLYLEVLEQSLVADVDVVFQKLSALRDQGVKISIDDFGTGYSSLSYFRDLPTDELKIDQSFVRGLKKDESNSHIVSLIIDLAHRFGLQVVAEGVEDQETLAFLKRNGCDLVQGYYISKPLPVASFNDWLETYQPEEGLLK